MPYNTTTGVFTRVDNSFSDPVAGTTIDPGDADLYYTDIDDGLSDAFGQFGTITETSVASAATCDIGGAATFKVRVTGSVGITSFGTTPNRYRVVTFAGSQTITYNATTLILPGNVDLATTANSTGIFVSDASGHWLCIDYKPQALSIPSVVAENLVYAGPGTGADAAPTFRALVAADYAPIVSANLVHAGPASGSAAAAAFRGLVAADIAAALVPGQIVGTATNDSATAGNVGEYVTAALALGSAVAPATDTAANIISISLTAGDWNVWGSGEFTGNGATTVNYQDVSVSLTSNTSDATVGRSARNVPAGATVYGFSMPQTVNTPVSRLSLGGLTTVYLVGKSGYGTNIASMYGSIFARRAR